jgi:RNA polymerase sigma-70 factor (ECF subfamily)
MTRNLEHFSGLDFEVACAEQDAEARVLSAERNGLVQAAIEELTALQRQCLVLRCEGLRYREIAEILCVSNESVADAIHRGVARLRQKLT